MKCVCAIVIGDGDDHAVGRTPYENRSFVCAARHLQIRAILREAAVGGRRVRRLPIAILVDRACALMEKPAVRRARLPGEIVDTHAPNAPNASTDPEAAIDRLGMTPSYSVNAKYACCSNEQLRIHRECSVSDNTVAPRATHSSRAQPAIMPRRGRPARVARARVASRDRRACRAACWARGGGTLGRCR